MGTRVVLIDSGKACRERVLATEVEDRYMDRFLARNVHQSTPRQGPLEPKGSSTDFLTDIPIDPDATNTQYTHLHSCDVRSA